MRPLDFSWTLSLVFFRTRSLQSCRGRPQWSVRLNHRWLMIRSTRNVSDYAQEFDSWSQVHTSKHFPVGDRLSGSVLKFSQSSDATNRGILFWDSDLFETGDIPNWNHTFRKAQMKPTEFLFLFFLFFSLFFSGGCHFLPHFMELATRDRKTED